MKATELIEKLNELVKQYGDLEMYIADDGEYPEHTISHINFCPKTTSYWYGVQSWEVPDRIEVG